MFIDKIKDIFKFNKEDNNKKKIENLVVLIIILIVTIIAINYIWTDKNDEERC